MINLEQNVNSKLEEILKFYGNLNLNNIRSHSFDWKYNDSEKFLKNIYCIKCLNDLLDILHGNVYNTKLATFTCDELIIKNLLE